MKSLSCRDLGGDCDFTVYGETTEIVKARILNHTKRDHADKLEDMSKEDYQFVVHRIEELLEKKAA